MISNTSFVCSLNTYIRVYLIVLLCWTTPRAWATSAPPKEDFIMHHVQDAHEWHFATIGHRHITLPLPIIICSRDRGLELFFSSQFKDTQHRPITHQGYRINHHDKLVAVDASRSFYDLSITKNVAATLLSVIMLLSFFLTIARQYQRSPQAPPRGVGALAELLICFVRDNIAIPNIGRTHYQRFMPYLLSVFFFIWLNNLLGLLPGAANVTGNISVTLVLALFTFFITNFNGNKHYWGHIFNTPGVPRWLSPIMIPVEILGLLTKPFSLMIRLFANITAGHIILLSIIGLIFILQSTLAMAFSLVFGTGMFCLKLGVALLQAYVFTLLSAIYFGAAVETHHEDAKNS